MDTGRNKWLRDAIRNAKPDPDGRPDNVPTFAEAGTGPAQLLDPYEGGDDEVTLEDPMGVVRQLRLDDDPGEDLAYEMELSPYFKPAPVGGGQARKESELVP